MKSRRRWSGRADDGATLVEYALVVSLVALGSVAGISSMEERSSQRLSEKADVAGAPDVHAAYVTAPPGSVPDGGTDPPPPVVEDVAVTASPSATRSGNSANWSATVTINVVDGESLPTRGATVMASWQGGEMSCVTTYDGSCSLTQSKLSDRTEVTYTFTQISGDGISGATLPEPVTITRPS